MSSSSSQTQPEADLASATQRHEQIRTKLRQLYTAFFILVKACRNPERSIYTCEQKGTEKCRKHHEQCRDLENFDGLIESVDPDGIARIDPYIREAVLASTPSPQMPRLVPIAWTV